jgi:hypothetical protein
MVKINVYLVDLLRINAPVRAAKPPNNPPTTPVTAISAT